MSKTTTSSQPNQHDARDDAILDQITAEYLNGDPAPKIALRHGVGETTIYRWLKSRDVPIRSLAGIQRKREVDDFAFSRESPDASYWGGFLLADGCVRSPQKEGWLPIIRLSLAITDGAHVELFRKFCKATYAIRYASPQTRRTSGGHTRVHAGTATLTMASKGMALDLARYGVVPRKTWSAEVPPHLANDLDFFRGLVDGDGMVHVRVYDKRMAYPAIGLVGTKRVCEQFADLILGLAGVRPTVRADKSIWITGLVGTEAIKVIRALYSRPGPALRRKAICAHAILAAEWGSICCPKRPDITKPRLQNAVIEAKGNLAIVAERLGVRGISSISRMMKRMGVALPEGLDRREHKRNTKLTQDIADHIRERVKSGATYADLASQYGVAPGTIGMIVRHRRWPARPQTIS